VVLLLHGQIEDDVFALDFGHPLSPLVAFSIVLSTTGW